MARTAEGGREPARKFGLVGASGAVTRERRTISEGVLVSRREEWKQIILRRFSLFATAFRFASESPESFPLSKCWKRKSCRCGVRRHDAFLRPQHSQPLKQSCVDSLHHYSASA